MFHWQVETSATWSPWETRHCNYLHLDRQFLYLLLIWSASCPDIPAFSSYQGPSSCQVDRKLCLIFQRYLLRWYSRWKSRHRRSLHWSPFRCPSVPCLLHDNPPRQVAAFILLHYCIIVLVSTSMHQQKFRRTVTLTVIGPSIVICIWVSTFKIPWRVLPWVWKRNDHAIRVIMWEYMYC